MKKTLEQRELELELLDLINRVKAIYPAVPSTDIEDRMKELEEDLSSRKSGEFRRKSRGRPIKLGPI